MTAANLCVICGRPTPDGFACHGCTRKPAGHLAEIADLAPIAQDIARGLIRRGRGNGGRGPDDSRSLIDFDTSARLDAVRSTLTTLVRDIAETAQIDSADPTLPDTLGRACSWLSERMSWVRGAVDGHEPMAIRVFAEIDACAREMRWLTDGPRERELVGMCDCGKVLYATRGRTVVTCPEKTCRLRWEVAESRDILRRALDGKLVTAAEAARLGAYLDTDRTQLQIRKLINAWSTRGQLVPHGWLEPDPDEQVPDGEEPKPRPTFRFGDIADRLSRTPRRNREGAAA